MLIYLASPYSKYPGGRKAAYQEVCRMAGLLMHQGYNVFCPIAHSHSIEMESFPDAPQNGDWWLKQDFAVLERCTGMFVYKMPGWEDSYGVQKEIEFAKTHNIPIEYLESTPAYA